jgi:outer membrane protein
MQKSLKLAALGIALTTAFPVMAQQAAEGNWMVRGRAVLIDTANESSTGPLGAALPSNAIHVSDKWIPEVDITYFITKNIAAELILTYPQKHNVKIAKGPLAGTDVGTFSHLPPTLNLQYHFNPDGAFRPYVGAGINYTLITSDNIDKALPLHLENDSWGYSLQAGFDYKVAPKVFLNFDVKKVQIGSDVTMSGVGKISHVKIDPWLLGIGVGYRF